MKRLLFGIVLIGLAVGGRVQTQPIAPYPSAPQCPTHDNRAWHGLWDPMRGCHYDHHHGDDPKALNDLFGTTLFALMGGEVSHPWQTFSSAGYENDLKHAGYFWQGYRNLPTPAGPGITDFRVLVHQHAIHDAAVRRHSYVFEGIVLNPASGRRGRILALGWMDCGKLKVDGVDVATPDGAHLDRTVEPGRHRQHASTGTPQEIWYCATEATHTPDRLGRIPRGFLSISTSLHDSWVYTSASNPASPGPYACPLPDPTDPRCRNNATVLRPHLLGVQVHASLRGIVDPDGDGVADWSGYTDRYGVPVSDCTAPSLDCSPVVLQGIETGVSSYTCGDGVCAGLQRDHDVYFRDANGRLVGSGWARPVQ